MPVHNTYFIVILAALIGFHLLDSLVRWLNLRALAPELPENFRDTYDPEKYRQSQQYTRANSTFALITSTFDLLILLAFWQLGGFPLLDGWTRSFGLSPIPTGLLYWGALVAAQHLLSLPFDIYDTFVLEAKFGFNKTTWPTWLADQAKGALLGILLGVLLGAPLLAYFIYAGPLAWLWAWLTMATLSLLLAWLAPAIILPLFNKFTPLPDGPLKDAITAYARKVSFPLGEISIVDGSRRSAKANAFFTGFGKTKRIALYDTLVAAQTTEELVAILAHEVGHFKKRHIITRVATSLLQQGALLWLASLFLGNPGLSAAFGIAPEHISVHVSLILFSLLLTPAGRVLGTLSAIISRANEFEADHYAATTTGSAQPLITALKKLSRDNLSNLTPHPLNVFLNHSHPPVLQRIAALERIAL